MPTIRVVPLDGTYRDGSQNGTEAANRVADVLMAFVDGPRTLGVSAIARELGVAKAVVHRMLQSLVSRGLIEPTRDGGEYQLGPSAVAIGARALQDLDLRRAAQEVLIGLRDATGETTTLSQFLGSTRVYLDQYEGQQEVKVVLDLGRPHALHAGATGKCMLAFLPVETRERILAGYLDQVTPATKSDPDTLRAELSDIVQTGVAVSVGERQRGVGAIASPVFGLHGEVLGAISVASPIQRFNPDVIAANRPRVRHAAEQISINLGWRKS
jgi:DNA-binding IclR family transcriptional regulator